MLFNSLLVIVAVANGLNNDFPTNDSILQGRSKEEEERGKSWFIMSPGRCSSYFRGQRKYLRINGIFCQKTRSRDREREIEAKSDFDRPSTDAINSPLKRLALSAGRFPPSFLTGYSKSGEMHPGLHSSRPPCNVSVCARDREQREAHRQFQSPKEAFAFRSMCVYRSRSSNKCTHSLSSPSQKKPKARQKTLRVRPSARGSIQCMPVYRIESTNIVLLIVCVCLYILVGPSLSKHASSFSADMVMWVALRCCLLSVPDRHFRAEEDALSSPLLPEKGRPNAMYTTTHTSRTHANTVRQTRRMGLKRRRRRKNRFFWA